MQPRRSAVAPSSVVNYLTNPGASGTAVLYDDLKLGATNATPDWSTAAHAVVVAVFIDKGASIYHQWAAPGSTTLRAIKTDTIDAGVLFEGRYRLRAGRNRIHISTGTACTTWEVGVEVDEFGGVVPSDLALLTP